MSKLAELFKQGNYDELWDRCCGFIDLSLAEVMKIQHRLLLEQIVLLKNCQLGQRIMGEANPTTVDEFREMVPLTTYDDYASDLLKRRMDVLPKKPTLWQYTSGKSGEYSHRWAPVTARQLDEIEPLLFALLLFSSCNKRKEIGFNEHDSFLYGMAPPPYTSGTMARVFPNEIFNLLPPVEEAERMSFNDRIKKGFDMGLSEGIDLCFSMSSVAVAIGRRLRRKNGKTGIKPLIKRPKALLRLAKGKIKSKLAGRPMMPKDIWPLKSLVTFGIDGSIFREEIKQMWGRYPLDFHGSTEAPLIAMQTWDYEGMSFVPNLNFFEFIPEEEAVKSWQDSSYQPKTYLLDELKPGNYELVITNLHGGPFTRLRLGHLIRIISLKNKKLGIDIPQMEFLTRVDDQIDIAGFTRLSEKIIWEAIENTGLAYKNWTARKEVRKDKPILHLYIELKENGFITTEQIANSIHSELKRLDAPYADLESFTGLRTLEVSLLPSGAFKSYKRQQQAAGVELALLNPPHINPTAAIIKQLVTPIEKVAFAKTEKVKA
jgi:hypothetical protein